MGLLELIVIVFLVLCILGGGWGYRSGNPGFAVGGGGLGFLLLIVLIILLVRYL